MAIPASAQGLPLHSLGRLEGDCHSAGIVPAVTCSSTALRVWLAQLHVLLTTPTPWTAAVAEVDVDSAAVAVHSWLVVGCLVCGILSNCTTICSCSAETNHPLVVATAEDHLTGRSSAAHANSPGC